MLAVENRGYLVCVTGLPGSGKSTAANLLTEHLRAAAIPTAYYSTDGIRDRLRPGLTDEERFGDWGPGDLDLAYNCLSLLVKELFIFTPHPFSIVADGTFRFEAQRSRLREIALDNNRQFRLIKVNTDEEIAILRAEQRLSRREGPGPTNYHTAKGVYEEPTDEVFKIDNNGNLNNLDSQIRSFVNSLHFLRN
jgi:predicted kinase